MRKILIIGIGAGDPDYVTVQAVNALNRVDAFFIPDKGTEKEELARLRLPEALVREDGAIAYPVQDGIPLLIAEEARPLSAMQN